jgi:hypothetical protein
MSTDGDKLKFRTAWQEARDHGQKQAAIRKAYAPLPDGSLPELSEKKPSRWPKPQRPEPFEQELIDMLDGSAEPMATDGCWLHELDGQCKHGHPSWPRHLGLVD